MKKVIEKMQETNTAMKEVKDRCERITHKVQRELAGERALLDLRVAEIAKLT